MPPRRPTRQARTSGYDPTVSISAASGAKPSLYSSAEQNNQESKQQSTTNDDLKKLIESLKSKLGGSEAMQQKQAPPQPQLKAVWNRSISNKQQNFKPAYSILTRISNHEKVPTRSTKIQELTTKALPDSFIFRPGADGIEIDKKLKVKAGKQLCLG